MGVGETNKNTTNKNTKEVNKTISKTNNNKNT